MVLLMGVAGSCVWEPVIEDQPTGQVVPVKRMDVAKGGCDNALGCMSKGQRAIEQTKWVDGYQYLAKSCQLRHGPACLLAASIVHHVPKAHKPLSVVTLRQRGCSYGHHDSCHALGQHHASEGNWSGAALIYKHSCDQLHGASCEALGNMYLSAQGVRLDFKKAHTLLTQACAARRGGACFSLGWMAYHARGQTQNKLLAIRMYKRGCDLNDMRACTSLGVLYERGDGVVKDEARAVGLFRRACQNREATACDNLGLCLSQGRGVKQDKVKALKWFKRACDLGDANGCLDAGLSYEHNTQPNQAVRYLDKACQLKQARACALLSTHAHVAEDDAAKYKQLACQYDPSCHR